MSDIINLTILECKYEEAKKHAKEIINNKSNHIGM